MGMTRSIVLERLRAKADAGLPIIGAGAGTGISAKCEEAGGVDLIVIYNSGRFRMAGCGSMAGLLAYGNANQIVVSMAPEVLSVVKRTPVLAGVCGTDPFLLRSHFLEEVRHLGFAGIQNFPTVGLIDGRFRENLEATGMSFALEIELIAEAHAMDLVTTPYVFDAEQSRLMTGAGADVLVAHMGLTAKGTIGATTSKSLMKCVDEIRRIADAAKEQRGDVLVLCHGGPIAMPEDVEYIFARCPEIDGFYGASSMERIPTESAISDQVRRFAGVKLGKSKGKSSPGRGRPAPSDSSAIPGNDRRPIGVE